jgi:hypothetical protein
MVNVFDYVDHRRYLADWFEEQKPADPCYSYQVFSQTAGFSNRGFVYNIIREADRVYQFNFHIFPLSMADADAGRHV